LQPLYQSAQHVYEKREGSGSVLVTNGSGCGSGWPEKHTDPMDPIPERCRKAIDFCISQLLHIFPYDSEMGGSMPPTSRRVSTGGRPSRTTCGDGGGRGGAGWRPAALGGNSAPPNSLTSPCSRGRTRRGRGRGCGWWPGQSQLTARLSCGRVSQGRPATWNSFYVP
jgi:hypothetical protein